jgi:hypothetical protein
MALVSGYGDFERNTLKQRGIAKPIARRILRWTVTDNLDCAAQFLEELLWLEEHDNLT